MENKKSHIERNIELLEKRLGLPEGAVEVKNVMIFQIKNEHIAENKHFHFNQSQLKLARADVNKQLAVNEALIVEKDFKKPEKKKSFSITNLFKNKES